MRLATTNLVHRAQTTALRLTDERRVPPVRARRATRRRATHLAILARIPRQCLARHARRARTVAVQVIVYVRVRATSDSQARRVVAAVRRKRTPLSRTPGRRHVIPRVTHASRRRPCTLRVEAAARTRRLAPRELVHRAQPRARVLTHRPRVMVARVRTAESRVVRLRAHHIVLRLEGPAEIRAAPQRRAAPRRGLSRRARAAAQQSSRLVRAAPHREHRRVLRTLWRALR